MMTDEPSYPPLLSVEEMQLHSDDLPDGCYWVCEHPERPLDRDCSWYDWRCRACVRHAEAVVTLGDDPIMLWAVDPTDGRVRNERHLSWLVARSKHLLAILP